jgi:tetratricopeptide (TPR) repeat protein
MLTCFSIVSATSAQDPFHDKLVYQVVEMQKVKLKEKNEFRKVNDTSLTFDIYYPPSFNFKTSLPVVVFNNGVGAMDIPRWGQYTDWCRLIAANGMVAVTHQSRAGGSTLSDCEALIDYLHLHAKDLGIDAGRIGLWTCSANSRVGARLAIKTRPDLIKAFVMYYGNTDSLGELRQDLPTLVVRAGLDAQFMNLGIENFVQASLVQDTRIEFINYLNGIHAFDLFTNTDESREVIKKTVDFLKNNLTKQVLPAKEFVLTNRNFMWLMNNNMKEKAVDEFRRTRSRYRSDSTFNPFFNGVLREDVLNANAYWLLNHQKQNEGLETFKLMVETYPESANAYDGLSDAWEAMGNKVEAIKNAETCLLKLDKDTNLDPQFKGRIRQSAEEKIRRLK